MERLPWEEISRLPCCAGIDLWVPQAARKAVLVGVAAANLLPVIAGIGQLHGIHFNIVLCASPMASPVNIPLPFSTRSNTFTAVTFQLEPLSIVYTESLQGDDVEPAIKHLLDQQASGLVGQGASQEGWNRPAT